jgi:methionyl-tRNA formyltransferase
MGSPLDIVFMGTPDFAVPALRKLCAGPHAVRLVVTQPDRPKGRGRKIHPPPVKAAALSLGCEVLQPRSIKDPELTARLESIRPDFLVVIAYGHILTKNLLAIPRRGAINIHASILPKYRGPAPIQWAIINGEKETGITAMLMDDGLDTGDILQLARTPISADDTSSTLHDRLSEMAPALLLETLEQFSSGAVQPAPQDEALASYAPLLRKKDGHIDWHQDADAIECMIRGMNPWPGAFTFLDDKRLKIWRAKSLPGDAGAPAGTVITGFPDELRVAAGSGILTILEIQGASGKRLDIRDFLRGCAIPPGTRLA